MSDSGQAFGSVGEEVTRLVQAAQEWLRQSTHTTDTGPCDICPVCRLLRTLTDERADVAARVGAVASAVIDAVRALFEPSGPPNPPDRGTTAGGAGHVEPIDIS